MDHHVVADQPYVCPAFDGAVGDFAAGDLADFGNVEDFEDLRVAANVVSGKHVADHVHAIVVPGSAQVKRQAEAEGLHEIFEAAGFEWRRAGCSMCLGMNPDVLGPGDRCASTSNRNFEGRQGAGSRTHLVSPAMAAAAAVAGHFADARELG